MKFKKLNNEKYNQILLYILIGLSLSLGIKYIFNHLNIIFTFFYTSISWLTKFIEPLFWGLFIAYLLYPLMKKYRMFFHQYHFIAKYEKIAAFFSTIITIILFFVLLFSLLISVFSSRLLFFDMTLFSSFLSDLYQNINDFYQLFLHYIIHLGINFDFFQSLFQKFKIFSNHPFGFFGPSFISSVEFLSHFFSILIFSLIFSLYFLIDSNSIYNYWRNVFYLFLGEKKFKLVHEFNTEINHIFWGYLDRQILDALFMSIVISVLLSIIGIKFSVVIGIFSGIGNLIPYLGPLVAYISTIFICVIEGEWEKLLISMILLLILQLIDANVIGPRLIGKNVDIHPMMILIALLIGESLAGFLGMFFAVPVAALLKKIFDRLLLKKQKEIHLSH